MNRDYLRLLTTTTVGRRANAAFMINNNFITNILVVSLGSTVVAALNLRPRFADAQYHCRVHSSQRLAR